MKYKYFILPLLLAANAALRASDCYRQIAKSWTSGSEFNSHDTDACTALLSLQMGDADFSIDSEALCARYVDNEGYHLSVRNYARALLGVVQKDLCSRVRNEEDAGRYARAARHNFLVALAMARKSGAYKDSQVQMVKKSIDPRMKTRYHWLTEEITDAEVEQLFQDLINKPEMLKAKI
ncbi:hypothetical protein A3F66_05435 [candidate division TM6 bacterium RIFCSPHIGHO2_12_FULL_32_22]|nr:MAG: hypothetical protein A3F66_05435 [candidate division TM6 bacterium RIFCSPHIGHO2_12_FULL_32_22]